MRSASCWTLSEVSTPSATIFISLMISLILRPWPSSRPT